MRMIDMENMGNIDLAKLIENMSEDSDLDISDEHASVEGEEAPEETQSETTKENNIKAEIEDTLEDIQEDEDQNSLYDSNTIKVVLQDYKELKEKYDELNDKYIRTMADFGNFRKRNLEENKAKIEKSKVSLLKEIIALNDTFDRALQDAEQNQSFENLFEGVQAIQKMVTFTLEKENVRPIEAIGEKFDPDYHDCILVTPIPGVEAETIVEETEKGYMLGKSVIRPSKVVVAAGSDEIPDDTAETEEIPEEPVETEVSTDEVEIPVNVIEEE